MVEMPREAQFGKRLRERRMECHLMQQELATKMGVPQTYVSRWEAGHFAYMTLERLRRLKKILGISLDQLVGLEEDAAVDAKSMHREVVGAETALVSAPVDLG